MARPIGEMRPNLFPSWEGSGVGSSIWLLALGYWPLRAGADDIPPLAPPLPEIQPTFWEQYGLLVSVAALLFIAVLSLVLWFILQPKPAPPVPPDVRVRAELNALLGGPETGAVLSRVSQSLRRYFAAAFGLPPDERTTTEFCQQLKASPRVGPELAAAVGGFLRECDERKFSPAPATVPLNAVQRALDLVAQAEVRRREPRASVMECGGPPPLLPGADDSPERQRTGALQDADAPARPPSA